MNEFILVVTALVGGGGLASLVASAGQVRRTKRLHEQLVEVDRSIKMFSYISAEAHALRAVRTRLALDIAASTLIKKDRKIPIVAGALLVITGVMSVLTFSTTPLYRKIETTPSARLLYIVLAIALIVNFGEFMLIFSAIYRVKREVFINELTRIRGEDISPSDIEQLVHELKLMSPRSFSRLWRSSTRGTPYIVTQQGLHSTTEPERDDSQ